MKFLKTLLIILLVIALSITGLYFYNEYLNSHVKLTKYNYRNEALPEPFDGFKIFVISDLHNAPFSDQIIDLIKETKPDMIAFTGDMVQLPDSDISEAIKISEAFKGKIPTYAVSGNHESQNKDYWDIYDEFYYSTNAFWLEGYKEKIKRDGIAISILGIADPEHDELTTDDYNKIREKINEELGSRSSFSILLSHRADIYPQIKNTGVDLILSGHLHGGIIRLPFVGGLLGKGGAVTFPEYEYGVFSEGDGATMIVSGGCDKNPDKMRIFNQPEVVLITLESE